MPQIFYKEGPGLVSKSPTRKSKQMAMPDRLHSSIDIFRIEQGGYLRTPKSGRVALDVLSSNTGSAVKHVPI